MWVKKIISLLLVIPGCFLMRAQENSASLHFQEALNFPRFQKMRSLFSVATNPSVLAYFSSNGWALAAEKRMAIPGWLQANGMALLSSKVGNWALLGETSGLEGFHRQQISISHARKLTNGISLGLTLGTTFFKATGYKVHPSPQARLGGFIELSEVLSMGFTGSATMISKRIIGIDFSPYWRFLFTLQYEPSSKFCFTWWSAKKSGFSSNHGLSFRYLFQEKVSFMAGLDLSQQLNWFGISIRRKKIVINLQAGWHSMLGISNNICLYGNHD